MRRRREVSAEKEADCNAETADRGGALAALVLALSACGGSSSSSASEEELQRESDLYAISQIEKSFHEAITKKNIDEMMSLFAPNATATFGPGVFS